MTLLVSGNLIPIRFLWLTLLAASSASSTYVQYVSGASFLPPRYPLKAKWYENDNPDLETREEYGGKIYQ
jgi:hypothetical protein